MVEYVIQLYRQSLIPQDYQLPMYHRHNQKLILKKHMVYKLMCLKQHW